LQHKKVVVIGAGIAGLSAAYYLKKAGVDASAYEARERVGGRIYSAKNLVGDGLVTELGAEFIDGSHADMLRFARWFGFDLLDVQTPAESKLKEAYYFGGKVRTGSEQLKAAQKLFQRIEKDRLKLSKSINYLHHSLSDARFDWLSLAEYLNTTPMDSWLRDLLKTYYTTEYGSEPEEQTALNMLTLLSTDASSDAIKLLGDEESIERYKIKGGNNQIVKRLAEKVGDIHLGTHLEAIEQGTQRYKVHLRKGSTSTVVSADYVVIAIPFSTLRYCRLDIPLTSVQRDAIQNLRYGTNAKVIVGVTECVWRKQGLSGSFTVEGAQTGWDSSRCQAGAEGSLTFFLGGHTGRDVGKGDASEVADQLVQKMNPVFPELSQVLNGKVHREHWPSDPWIRGSYACYSPGYYTRLLGAFLRPVGNVYFAGEHLSQEFQGYMNGGAETGRKVAEKMIRRLK
jgi:monoamine oxidase